MDCCAICTERGEYAAYGDCNHPVCHLCALRLRILYKQSACPMCKSEMKSVVLCKSTDRPFEKHLHDRQTVKDKKIPGGILFESSEIHDQVILLLRHNCPTVDCDFACTGWTELKSHCRKQHDKQLCEICLKNKKCFAHEHQLFSTAELNKHMKTGDTEKDPSFRGHPECEFCRKHFYSPDELYEHCREKHETCHICRQQGVRDQYYRDYQALEVHFGKDHYLCKDRECLEKKFVVFASDIDYKAHMAAEHGARLSKVELKQTRRVDVEFRVAGRGGSGEDSRGAEEEFANNRRRGGRNSSTNSHSNTNTHINSSHSSSSSSSNSRNSSRRDGELQSQQVAVRKEENINSDSGRILSKPLRPPPGFGGQLSADNAPLQSLSAASSMESLVGATQQSQSSPTVVVEEWPSIDGSGAGDTPVLNRQESQRVFPNELEAIGGTIGALFAADPSLRRKESQLAPRLAQSLRYDRSKWLRLRQSCWNYLKGNILAEKFYDEFFQLAGLAVTNSQFPSVVSIFPELMRPALLRVFNDKRAFKDPFPSLTASASTATTPDSGSCSNTLAKSRVLVIKSTAARNMSAFDRTARRQNSQPPKNFPSVARTIDDQFPSLSDYTVARPKDDLLQDATIEPSSNKEQQQQQQQTLLSSNGSGGNGKRTKKQKARLLMSTSLRINNALPASAPIPPESMASVQQQQAAKLEDFSKLTIAANQPISAESADINDKSESKVVVGTRQLATDFPALPPRSTTVTTPRPVASSITTTTSGNSRTSEGRKKRVVLRFG